MVYSGRKLSPVSSKASSSLDPRVPTRFEAGPDLRLAADLTAAGRVDEALEHLRGLVVRRPDCSLSRRALAELCFEVGCVDEAIRHGQTLLEQRPRSRVALSLLGAAYFRRGDLERARWCTDTLIAVEPREPTHHYQRALLLEQGGDLGGAARAMRRAQELEPSGDLASDIRMGLRLLDSVQLCEIVQRADEEVLFNLDLRRDPVSAVAAHGYCLSSFGLALLEAASRDLPPASAARHLRGH